MNDNGIYFPLFGICLGFELLLYASNVEREYRTICSSSKQKNTLNFTKGMAIGLDSLRNDFSQLLNDFFIRYFDTNKQIFATVVYMAKHQEI